MLANETECVSVPVIRVLCIHTDIPHGGSDFGEFFIGKTTHSAFPGAEASAGAPP